MFEAHLLVLWQQRVYHHFILGKGGLSGEHCFTLCTRLKWQILNNPVLSGFRRAISLVSPAVFFGCAPLQCRRNELVASVLQVLGLSWEYPFPFPAMWCLSVYYPELLWPFYSPLPPSASETRFILWISFPDLFQNDFFPCFSLLSKTHILNYISLGALTCAFPRWTLFGYVLPVSNFSTSLFIICPQGHSQPFSV